MFDHERCVFIKFCFTIADPFQFLGTALLMVENMAEKLAERVITKRFVEGCITALHPVHAMIMMVESNHFWISMYRLMTDELPSLTPQHDLEVVLTRLSFSG